MAKVAADITDLKDYQTQLQQQIQQTSDPAASAQLNAQLSQVNSQIESAKNWARVGLMALDGGNFDTSTISDSEYLAIGAAFGAAEAAEIRAAAKARTAVANLIDNAKWDAEQAAETAVARTDNNISRDGGLADPSRPMSASGPWKSVAELTPDQANRLVESALQGAGITGTISADAANAQTLAKNPTYSPSYMPGTNIVEFVNSSRGDYVRVSGGESRPTANWIMKASDIAGLTPEQIAATFALPAVPTQIGDVKIPAGTKLQASVANGVLLGNNPGGGGVQFYIPEPPESAVFQRGLLT